MTQKLLASALLTGLVVVLPAAVQAQIDDDFSEVVLYATDSMEIDQNTTVVSGDVVVNTDSAAAFELTVGNKVAFPASGEVKANAITAGNFVTFAGVELCNVGVGLTGCAPGSLALPVYDTLPLFHAASPGLTNYTVANGDSLTLSPGSYGTLVGGVESTIIFEPGVYDFQSINVDRKGGLLFQGDTEIRVAGAITLGVEVDVRAAAGFTVAARQVVFYAGGNAAMGAKSTTNANVYSLATLTLPSNIIATGAFLGLNVVVEAKSNLSLDSAFVNLPPLAVNDAATTPEDTAVVIPVLANDSDPNGDAISVAAVADPPNGAATTDGTTVTYTPDANYCNDGAPTDDFNYTVCDNSTSGILCSNATVSVTVTCVNDPPTANDDAYNATEDTTLNVGAPGVLGNDVDVDSTLSVSAFDATSAQGGTVSVAADGSFTYSPATNFCGNDSFGYTASDGEFSSSATVSISVECVNDAPVANDDAYNATEDSPLSVAAPGVLGNDTDVENDPLSVSASDSTSAQGGTVAVAADGSFTYDPAADFCGSDSFGYTASDSLATDTATVTIEVACVNDPPTANDDAATTNQDTAVVIPVLANDTDPDNDPLTVTLNQQQTSSGSMTTDGTSVTYTPVANFFGEDRFSYTACDNGSPQLCDSAEVVVTVVDVAQPPFANAQDVIGVSGVTSITLTGGDPDGNSLTFDLVTAPRGSLTGLPATDDSPAFDTSRSVVVSYDSQGDDSEDSFVFSVFDGTFTAQATVRINPGATDPGSDEPDPLADVVAKDLLCNPQDPEDCDVEAFQGQTAITILLVGAAPCEDGFPTPEDPDDAEPCDGLGNDVPLTFSLPSLVTSQGGTLSNFTQGSEVPQRTATVDYLAPSSAFTGKDTFTFSVVGDVNDSGSIDQPNESDSGTVEVNVLVFTEPAPLDLGGDRTVGFRDQTPVVIDLAQPPAPDAGNPHGTQAAARSLTGTSGARGTAENGAEPAGPQAGVRGPQTRVALASGVWEDFTWGGTIPVFATDDATGDASYDFSLNGNGCVSVTDDFDNGDQFRLYDNGQSIGETTPVAKIDITGSVGSDNAFADPSYSSGTFALGAGSHSITVEVIGESFSGGRAYIRVDDELSGRCDASPAPNLTIVEFSAPRLARQGGLCTAQNGCYAFGDSIRVVVANTGNVASSGGFVGLYVSPDSAVTTADTLLIGGRESLPNLAPGQSARITLNGVNAIPDTVAAGDIFLGAVVDDTFVINEISETDNTASQGLLYQSQPLYTIETLPQGGTLSYASFDGQGVPIQEPITSAPFTLPAISSGIPLTSVTYTSSAGTVSDGFNVSVSDGLTADTAIVNLAVVAVALGDCEDNESLCDDGRNGGLAPLSGGASGSQIDRKIGGSRLTIRVEGKGDVATSRRWHDGISYVGVTCSGGEECGGNFAVGSAVVLYARPTEYDSEFVEWRGDCSGSEPVTVITIQRGAECTAVFGTVSGD